MYLTVLNNPFGNDRKTRKHQYTVLYFGFEVVACAILKDSLQLKEILRSDF